MKKMMRCCSAIAIASARQPPLLLQVSDEEDDEMSATRHISSREALTPVRPIRQAGRKWGRRMPSPFDDPSTSTDLDEEEAELEGLEEAASPVSSELDPSVTNPVSCLLVSADSP